MTDKTRVHLRLAVLLALAALFALSGCGGGGRGDDGGVDAGADAGLDAGSDADGQAGDGEEDGGGADGGDADGGDAGGDETPIRFARHPSNPVYEPSGSLWNFAGIGDPSVIFDVQDGIYKMWTSAAGVLEAGQEAIVRTQVLTSFDGIDWTELPGNPVLLEGGPGEWDRGGVETVTVLRDGATYLLWYGGYEQRADPPLTLKIGLAVSDDGINWVKSAANPVLGPGAPGEWDESWVESPTVVKVGGTFFMWYSGIQYDVFHFAIGLATSPDGETWTKHPANPVLGPEPANNWEDALVYAPAVIHDGERLVMWYVGINAQTFLDAMRIGMAYSDDGATWTREPSNPVLDLGEPGEWDEKGAFVPSVVLRDAQYQLYYLSGGSQAEKLGLATWPP